MFDLLSMSWGGQMQQANVQAQCREIDADDMQDSVCDKSNKLGMPVDSG